MELDETPKDRAARRVIEAERRLVAQFDWIAEMTRMGYDTASEWDALQGMCNAIRQARAELDGLLLDQDEN
ncbi:hypothetical protein [Azohydromonas aeria]|uniref:hypothetical protein n=1 Tax=Azohydromonas aeria TaxID=2590212 RepID=UPI0012F75374|nr:hypothetical protein [Azohydromonas aeria]